MHGVVQVARSVTVVGVAGLVRDPVEAFHLTTTKLEVVPLYWIKATSDPSRERTGDVVTMEPVPVL
jgi:hypothetical protein